MNESKCKIQSGDLARIITRIASFIVEELVSCFEFFGDKHLGLLACLKTGIATPDLVDSVAKIGSDSIPLLDNKETIARDLFISCSLCFPSLAAVNGDLLLSLFHLVDSFEWVSGKGIALLPILRACQSSRAMNEDQIQDIYSGYVALFDGRTDTSEKAIDSKGLDELFYSLNGSYWKPSPVDVRDLLVDNEMLFDEVAQQHVLLACYNSLGSLFCLGTADIWSLAQLDSTIPENDILGIVNTICEASHSQSKKTFRGTGTILTGLLASIENIQSIKEKKEPGSKSETEGDHAVVSINFSRLPRPQSGTVIANTIDLMEKLLEDTDSSDSKDNKLSRAIACLGSVSIPSIYATLFLEPLLKENIARHAGMDFLCSQVTGRRKAFVDGQSFFTLTTRVCVEPSEVWFENIGPGSTFEKFTNKLLDVVPKLPVEKLNDALLNFWERCLTESERKLRFAAMLSFLKSIKDVLSSKVPSFKTLATLRRFVLVNLFMDICNLGVESTVSKCDETPESIFDVFVQCLKEIPLSLLEEANFLKVPSSDTFELQALRILIILELLKEKYFDSPRRETQELAQVTQWLSKSTTSSTDVVIQSNIYRRVACSFASTMNGEHTMSIRDALAAILDVLLLTKDNIGSRLGLSWLGIVVSYLCSGEGTDYDLSLGYLCALDPIAIKSLPAKAFDQLFSVVLNDLPYNLISISRREKLSAAVSNYLHRIHSHWLSIAVDDDIMHCIQRAIISEQGSMAKEDAFLGLASSILGNIVSEEECSE